jgi:hypothetical protein
LKKTIGKGSKTTDTNTNLGTRMLVVCAIHFGYYKGVDAMKKLGQLVVSRL